MTGYKLCTLVCPPEHYFFVWNLPFFKYDELKERQCPLYDWYKVTVKVLAQYFVLPSLAYGIKCITCWPRGSTAWGDHPSSFTYCGSSLECSSLHPIYCSFNKQGFRFLFSHNKQSAGTWFWHDFSCSAKLSQTPALSAHLLSFIFPGPVEAYSSHLRACHFPVARWLL